MKLSKDDIFYLNALQSASGVTARDCVILNDTINFVVKPEDMGKVIGKEGKSINQLSRRLGKRTQAIAYYDDLQEFLEKAFDAKIQEIELVEKEAIVKTNGIDRRKMLANRQRFNIIVDIAKRNYDLKDLKLR